MIKTLKRLIAAASVTALFAVPVMMPVVAHAAATGGSDFSDCGGISGCLDTGANKTDPNASTVDATEKVNSTITLVINVFSLIVGVISVIMIIVGGLKYITSGGEAGNITGAKNTILYAIIGLVVVAMAQIVVKFVLQKATQ